MCGVGPCVVGTVIDKVFDSLDHSGNGSIKLQDVVEDMSQAMHMRIERLDEMLGTHDDEKHGGWPSRCESGLVM